MAELDRKRDRTELRLRIQGWGADLDPKNRPGIPRERAPKNGTGAHWKQPEQQTPPFKIHVSVERPGITPVFGTTCPPKLLSGKIRDLAYARWSEATTARWVSLLLADRIDMVEELVADVFRGKLPNPFSEVGLKGEFRNFGRLKFIRSEPETVKTRVKQGLYIAAGVGAILGAGMLLSSRREAA